MKRYAYTGDVKLLKTIGFTFHKLYAANYKTYMRDDVAMFVTTNMVLEVSAIRPEHHNAVIEFIIANKHQPREFWVFDRPCGKFTFTDMSQFHLTQFGNVVNDKEMKDLYSASLVHVCTDAHRDGTITDAERDRGIQLKSECEGGQDPFHLTLKFVNLVIELDNLHPLEMAIYA